eukprot:1094173-Pelagomonas_calceolata.AAC.4
MGPIRDVCRGGWIEGGSTFWDPKKTFEPFSQNYKYIFGFLSSTPVNWHPVQSLDQKEEVSVHDSKSVPHTDGSGPQGVWRQTWIVTMYNVYCVVKLGGQFVDLQASCGCLAGQMDEELKEEQIDTRI